MLILYILCTFIYFQHIFGSTITPDTRNLSAKNVRNESHYENNNRTVFFISEGGSLLPNTTSDIRKLPKDKVFLSLDSEMGKNKEKPVFPRTGGVYNSVEDIQNSTNTMSSEKNNVSLVQKNHTMLTFKENMPAIKTFTEPQVSTKIITNHTSQEIKVENKTKVEVSKKPLVLSNAELDKINFVNSDQTTFHLDGLKTKVPKNPNSHPDMIMPIIITILVVPMFAVIGYLALKRGQEAWKNRHYKRMDFLLDGMYND